MIPALGNRARAIGHAFAALKQFRDHRVMFETLEFYIRENIWVLVTKVHHEADVDLIVFKVIDERPATCVALQWPAHRMGHATFFVLGRVDFPDFFHAQAVFLRLFALVQPVFRDHLFGQRSAHTFGQEDIFAMQFHAWFRVRPDCAVRFKPKYTGNDAFDFPIVAKNQL